MAATEEEREFVQHVVDLMQVVGPVTSRGMFGGYGLFLDGVMIGLVAWGDLYLKVDSENEPLFSARGLERFVYKKDEKEMWLSYCHAPEEVFDEPDEMRQWGTSAWDAALRGQAAKAKKTTAGQTSKKSGNKASKKT